MCGHALENFWHGHWLWFLNVPRQYFPGEECPKETVRLASRSRLGRPNSLVWTISWEIWISSRWCGRKSRCMEKCTCFFAMLFSLLVFLLVLNVQVWCNVSQHSTDGCHYGLLPSSPFFASWPQLVIGLFAEELRIILFKKNKPKNLPWYTVEFLSVKCLAGVICPVEVSGIFLFDSQHFTGIFVLLNCTLIFLWQWIL